MSIKLEELKYGEMATVQVKAPKFYKARFFNYADYSEKSREKESEWI